MKISYKWLQSYFTEKLPEPEKLAELITFGFAEVESIEKKENDSILDVKVLPDRACYALSHRGVVYEISAITGLQKKTIEYPKPPVQKTRELSVKVEVPDLCPRYMARVIENVTQKEMSWVKDHLGTIGQRSINPVVDGANLIMFDMGQPLHAFDADKVKGGIIVRYAKNGEKITTLDNREVNLDESVLVIADEEVPLAIAGIKGGKRAEVTTTTKNLILESASFDASYIRKTADKLGIKTDASKRYENKLSSEFTEGGMNDFSAYLFEMDKNIRVGGVLDCYPNKLQVVSLKVDKEDINEKLGVDIPETGIESIFKRLEIGFTKDEAGWKLIPPFFRKDLCVPEDFAEEVGRIYGLDKIRAILPPKSQSKVEIPKSFYYEWKIREILVNAGFSEIMNSSFSEKGSVAILKPLAEDKSFARQDLRGGFAPALVKNLLNAPLFGLDEVRVFEIGRVFTKGEEVTSLAIGYGGQKKKVVSELSMIVNLLSERLGVAFSGETKDGVFECVLDSLFSRLPEPTNWDISIPKMSDKKFKQFSLYPFIVRDIALFVPSGTLSEEVHKLILKEAGEFVVRSWLFDTFEKDGKISYAFRIVFQSSEKTFTDEEINKVMDFVYGSIKERGWIVR